jgi:hypothetical protein
LISSGSVQDVPEGSVDYPLSVGFAAVADQSIRTATITWLQTNWPDLNAAPGSALGQIIVLAENMSCPVGGGGGGGGGGHPQVTGVANPASLDIFPDDVYLWPGAAITTTWTVPAGFGRTLITYTSPSSLVHLHGGGDYVSDDQTSSVTTWFSISSQIVPSPVNTEIVFTASSANNQQTTHLSVPIRIEATRPPAVMGVQGDIMNMMIDFGTVGEGGLVNRTLSLINQGPALSRFHGDPHR